MIGETNANKIIGGEQSEATQVLNIILSTNQDDHSDLIGVVVTVSYGSTILDFTWDGEIITVLVPMGVEYTIKYTDVENYLTPDNQTFIADSVSRIVNVVYEYVQEILSGVYIQTTDNKYYTSDEWSSVTGKTANGVAVFTDTCKFVVAKDDIWSNGWGGYGINVAGLTDYTSDTNAATDLNGINHTTQIINAIVNYNDGYRDGSAAEDCAAYTFPNGKTGYLGAAGEWKVASLNKEAINDALTLIGGTTIGERAYWTSTEYSAYDAWHQYIGSTIYLSYRDKNATDRCIRAFLAI